MALGTSISSGHSQVHHGLFCKPSRSKSIATASRRTSSLAKRTDAETEHLAHQRNKKNAQPSNRKVTSSNKQSPVPATPSSTTPHSINLRKASTFVKPSISIDSLRSVSTGKSDQIHTRSSRQVQRCAVSRQVCVMTQSEELAKTRAKSSSVSSRVDPNAVANKPKITVRNFCFGIKTSAFVRPTEKPVRPCQKNEQSPSPPSRTNTPKISHPPVRVPLQKSSTSKSVSKKINHWCNDLLLYYWRTVFRLGIEPICLFFNKSSWQWMVKRVHYCQIEWFGSWSSGRTLTTSDIYVVFRISQLGWWE